MARTFDFTRYVVSTVVSAKVADFETMSFKDIDSVFDGCLDKESAEKAMFKRYGKCNIISVTPVGIMYGLTSEDVQRYGTQLNPVTRQPWGNESSEEKAKITYNYMTEYLSKKSKIDEEQ